jgi:hypothetical protein
VFACDMATLGFRWIQLNLESKAISRKAILQIGIFDVLFSVWQRIPNIATFSPAHWRS